MAWAGELYQQGPAGSTRATGLIYAVCRGMTALSMSVAVKPSPEGAAAPAEEAVAASAHADDEGWALLEALRRRMDEQISAGRKTQQQVTQLAESIGALVSEQRARSRWANLNSFTAYVIFTLLVGAGAFLLYRTRATELVEARARIAHERDLAVRSADTLAQQQSAREQADAGAFAIYELLAAGKRDEAAAQITGAAAMPLSRTERAVLAGGRLLGPVPAPAAALEAAARSFKAGRHAEVIGPLEAVLVSEPTGARAASLRYFLGVAYAKQNDLPKAITHLRAAIASNVDQEDARFHLASALDRTGQYALARGEYDRFATAHPQSTLATFAMRRSATLARLPKEAPAGAAAPAAPAPVVPAGASGSGAGPR